MNARFCDHEDPANPMNGYSFMAKEVVQLLRSLQGREPFMCSLEADAGTLLVGVSENIGCVQFTSPDGQPPYMMATVNDHEDGNQSMDFLSGGTPSPIPERYCLPWPLVERIVAHFLDQGAVPSDFRWEEI